MLEKKLKLYRTENIGPVTYNLLTSQYSLDEALDQVKIMAQAGGKKNIKIPKDEDIELEIQETKKIGGEIICSDSKSFPKIKNHQKHFPPILSILGNKDLLSRSIIGLIGTRNPSLQGVQYSRYMGEYLGKRKKVILSGFAKGIDSVVHESSLKTGTIGFLPCGINVVFPSVNLLLYQQIKEQGLLITDRPFGQDGLIKNFPQRNKYIVLLCEALILLEGAINSGSMMTGNFALKYNCPIFSVPGHPLDNRYGGNNNLLKKGAKILDNPQTIIDFLDNPSLMEETSIVEDFLIKEDYKFITDKMRLKVVNVLSHIPVSMETICEYVGFSLGEVNYILIELELGGKIERTIDDKISLIFTPD